MRTRADSPTKTCTLDGCAGALRARGLCSTHYNHVHQPGRHRAHPTNCTVCGVAIKRPHKSDRRPICSVECRGVLEWGTPTSGTYDWATAAAERARRAGATVIELFDREDVFIRDGWTCYLCGEPVDRDASPFDPRSPTVDHVVPLSRGGEHTMANAKCAHLRCNSAKQDRDAT